jgi:hypothetical protein
MYYFRDFQVRWRIRSFLFVILKRRVRVTNERIYSEDRKSIRNCKEVTGQLKSIKKQNSLQLQP